VLCRRWHTKKHITLLILTVAAAAFFSFGCNDSAVEEATPDMNVGKESGPCYPDKSCNPGLICADNICVAEPIPSASPLIPNGAWATVLTGTNHPRLIGPKDFLVSLTNEKKKLYNEIKAEIVTIKSSFNTIVGAGVEHAVDRISDARIATYVAEADQYVKEGATNAHQEAWLKINHVAQTFDFFYDKIPAEKRKAMIKYLNDHLSVYTTDEWGLSSNIFCKIFAYLHVAYATWGENPRAKEFRNYALIDLYEKKLVPILSQLGDGGGYTDGGWYTRNLFFYLVRALELARRIEGYDGFAKAPKFFYERLAYELLQPYPGTVPISTYQQERYAMEGDGVYASGGTNDGPRLERSIIAQYFRGSTLARYTASKWRKASYAPIKTLDLLFVEDPENPLELSTMQLSHLAAGIGRIYARGSWDNDATWLRFECGPHYVGHQHLESGNFEIFREEPLATESGVYNSLDDYLSNHTVNWYIRTIAHNSMLVFMPDETWAAMRDGGKHTYLNDGGQETRWNHVHTELSSWLEHKNEYQSGELKAYINQDDFMYAMCDATKAYNPKKLSKWTREILFLRPHTFVILDRVNNDVVPYVKKWLLHSRYEPKLDKNEYTITGNKHALYVKTLLPASSAEKIYDYKYNNQTVYPLQRDPEENLWRIEVKPMTNPLSEIFLTVISTEEMPAANASVVKTDFGNDVDLTIGNIKITLPVIDDGNITIGDKTHILKKKIKAGIYEK